MRRLHTAVWAGIVLAILVEFGAFCLEFWLNTSGLVHPIGTRGGSSYLAPLFRNWIYSAGFPSDKPIVLSAIARAVLGFLSFVLGATWMWWKTADVVQVRE